MKYFTKQWYKLCQKTDAHLSLEESKKAESFSEEYFQSLYQVKLNEFLEAEQEMSSASFDDFYPVELNVESLEGMSEDEIKKSKQLIISSVRKQSANLSQSPTTRKN